MCTHTHKHNHKRNMKNTHECCLVSHTQCIVMDRTTTTTTMAATAAAAEATKTTTTATVALTPCSTLLRCARVQHVHG